MASGPMTVERIDLSQAFNAVADYQQHTLMSRLLYQYEASMGEVAERELLTIEQFCSRHKAFTTGGVRWQVFNEEKNGLKASGAILRVGRRVLIDPQKYFRWIDDQQQRPGS